MPADAPRIVIVGAGPTGLGAAWRLQELGHTDWDLYERAETAGGLASSVVDDQGFTWDLGGHVLFSHYEYFDRLMDTAVANWVEHEREAWVWIRNRWIPYPFQNNIWRLPDDDLIACLEGLLDLHRAPPTSAPRAFDEWLLQSFGRGLCDTFMFPYNRKVWAYDPGKLDVGWMGERVATVDLTRVLRNLVRRTDDVAWGPNATFRFPLHGGTGAIWRSVADRLPAERMHYGCQVTGIDTRRKILTFGDGSTTPYDTLLSTMPLDHLLLSLRDQPTLTARASQFVHSSSHIVGVGLAGETPEEFSTKCWMYFPEDQAPFYRCTVFSNYSPHNVPAPGRQWSLMAEVSESPDKPVDGARVLDETVAGMRACNLIRNDQRIVSRWHRRLSYGYPTPWLGRDGVLMEIDAQLTALDILSRGRFGGWKYEVSNQDHSVMQGVEAVDHVLRGSPQPTYDDGM